MKKTVIKFDNLDEEIIRIQNHCEKMVKENDKDSPFVPQNITTPRDYFNGAIWALDLLRFKIEYFYKLQ